MVSIFNASSCYLLYFFNITPTVTTVVYLKTLECLFKKNRSYKNCIMEPYIVVSMSPSLTDLLQYPNEKVNFALAAPAASTQGTNRFHILDLRL